MNEATARVGLSVELEGRDALFQQIGEVQDRLAAMLSSAQGSGYNPLATPPSNQAAAPQQPPGYPTFAHWNAQTGHSIPLAFDPGQGSFFNPNTGAEYKGASWPGGEGAAAASISIQSVTSITVQTVTNLVIQNVAGMEGGVPPGPGAPGGAGGAGGPGEVPQAPGGGGGGGEAPSAARPWSERFGIPGFLGSLLKGYGAYQLLQAGMGASSDYLQYALAGGDVLEQQRTLALMQRIPVLGHLAGPILAPIMEKDIQLKNIELSMKWRGMTPNLPEDRWTSPTLLREMGEMTQLGFQIPPDMQQLFREDEWIEGPLDTSLGPMVPPQRTRYRNPRYLPPYERMALGGAYRRIRATPYAMLGFGYGGLPTIPQAALLAEAMGDWQSAQALRAPEEGDEMARWRYAEVQGGEVEQQLGTGLVSISAGTARYYETLGRRQDAWRASVFRGMTGLRRAAGGLAQQQAFFERTYEEAKDLGESGAMAAAESRLQNIRRELVELQQTELNILLGAAQTLHGGAMREYGARASALGAELQIAEVRGVGFEERMGLGIGGVGEQARRAEAATNLYRSLQQAGVTGAPLAEAWATAREAQARQVSAATGLAGTPIDLDLQRQLSFQQFQAQVLSAVPGSYGNLRGALRGQIEGLGQAAAQVQEMMELQRRAGSLNPEAEFQYQQRLQQIGLQQQSAFQQLSWGWESRLVGQMLNAPGDMDLEARGFAYRDAVLGGAWNPHFGATREQLPFFMRYAANVPFPVVPGRRDFPTRGPAGTFWGGVLGDVLEEGGPWRGRIRGRGERVEDGTIPPGRGTARGDGGDRRPRRGVPGGLPPGWEVVPPEGPGLPFRPATRHLEEALPGGFPALGPRGRERGGFPSGAGDLLAGGGPGGQSLGTVTVRIVLERPDGSVEERSAFVTGEDSQGIVLRIAGGG